MARGLFVRFLVVFFSVIAAWTSILPTQNLPPLDGTPEQKFRDKPQQSKSPHASSSSTFSLPIRTAIPGQSIGWPLLDR